jgi:hypothetical protein
VYCLVGMVGRGGRRLSERGGNVSIDEDGFMFGEKPLSLKCSSYQDLGAVSKRPFSQISM